MNGSEVESFCAIMKRRRRGRSPLVASSAPGGGSGCSTTYSEPASLAVISRAFVRISSSRLEVSRSAYMAAPMRFSSWSSLARAASSAVWSAGTRRFYDANGAQSEQS